MQTQLTEIGAVLIFLISGPILLLVLLGLGRLVRLNRPSREKNTAYESGEEPVGSPWGKFNLRFYVIALLFLLFDVELVFLYPWATISANKELSAATDGSWPWIMLGELLVFLAVLSLGLAYAWANGYLEWARPEPKVPVVETGIPDGAYQGMMGKSGK